MFQYLVASFPEKRNVNINGEFMGFTDELLELEEGMYEVTLDPAQGVEPASQEIDLCGTAYACPMIIRFEEVRR